MDESGSECGLVDGFWDHGDELSRSVNSGYFIAVRAVIGSVVLVHATDGAWGLKEVCSSYCV
jgi:hypothetical protein